MTFAWIDELKNWQDLIGAIVSLAVGVAAIAISVSALKASQRQVDVARMQLEFAQRAEDGRQSARERAMRAALSPVLSGICKWARESADALRSLPPVAELRFEIRESFVAPSPPLELVSALVQLIEATNDESVINRAARLIGNIQIVSARHEFFKDRNLALGQDNMDGFFNDLLVVHAQADSLFDFARHKTEAGPGPLTWQMVANATNSLNLHGPAFSTLYQRLGRLATSDADPEEL